MPLKKICFNYLLLLVCLVKNLKICVVWFIIRLEDFCNYLVICTRKVIQLCEHVRVYVFALAIERKFICFILSICCVQEERLNLNWMCCFMLVFLPCRLYNVPLDFISLSIFQHRINRIKMTINTIKRINKITEINKINKININHQASEPLIEPKILLHLTMAVKSLL